LVLELKEAYRKGRISRREFLRKSALLGASLVAMNSFLAGCARQAQEAPPENGEPAPAPGGVVRGGTLRASSVVSRVDHPARLSWVAPSNMLRNVFEYLSYTDEANITHPYLLEKWEPSEDLKTWGLHLKKGITWNNGQEFTADDVVFTLKQWLDPEVGSSTLGLMSYLSPGNIEKVNDYEVKLHLDNAQIGVPEHLFHYPNFVLHRSFEGDVLKAPVGTGPFTIQEWLEGERVVLKRRDGYWQTGADGQALPYLDEVIFIDLGDEVAPHVTAFQAGRIDHIDFGDLVDIDGYRALKDFPGAVIQQVTTASTRVLRMRVDRQPYDDNRVRLALKLCQDREKILSLTYFGEGVVANDAHVAPSHPEYYDLPPLPFDTARAKALLAEAGYPDGIDLKLTVASGYPEQVAYAEVLQQDAAAAGFRIQIEPVPTSVYWDQWTEVDLGITWWGHRPLGTMCLRLAYTAEADGTPVPWNETRWVDQEFQTLLDEAEMTLDVDERRRIIHKLQEIQRDRGSIGIAYWSDAFAIFRKGVENLQAHPSQYCQYHDVWLQKA
jgi:peptide/nickel transport system substrate-binding protein